MKHTAIYLRVSTADQTVATQLPDLLKWAVGEGLPVPPDDDWIQKLEPWDAGVVVFYPDKFTGTSMDRPNMQKLNAAVEAGQVERIIVWRLDRLGRTCAGLTRLFQDLRKRGVGFISLRDGFDFSTPAGRLQAQILASVAEFETEVRRERQAAGIAAARAQSEQIHDLRQDGASIERIETITQLKRERIAAILAKPRGSLWYGGREMGVGRTKIDRARLNRLLSTGLTMEEIAKVLGVARRTLYRMIKRKAPTGDSKQPTWEAKDDCIEVCRAEENGEEDPGDPAPDPADHPLPAEV